MQKKRIYVVEDEVHITELLLFHLEKNGFVAEAFTHAEAMFEACQKKLPDLFLLDIMLPGMDGLSACRRLKMQAQTKKIPIFMLSAKGEAFDRILGLELGADDYISKPFNIREVVIRVKGLFRRQEELSTKEPALLLVGNIAMDLDRREVWFNQKLLDLTYKEFELLKLLVSNGRKVLSREIILEKIWGIDYEGGTRTVDVHIRHLRQKLGEEEAEHSCIETIRGIGYCFHKKEESSL